METCLTCGAILNREECGAAAIHRMVADAVQKANTETEIHSMEKGILYAVGKEAGEAIAAIQDALADKKVSIGEGIDIAKEIGTLIVPIVANRKELAAAVKDGIDLAEEDDFKSGFIEGYDVKNDEVENTVEAVFEGVVSVVSGVVRIFVKDDEE